MLALIQEVANEPLDLQESRLQASDSEFWQSTFLNSVGHPISGGFGRTRHEARKIACAEFLERKFHRELLQSADRGRSWGLDIIPTGCGFAVGFNAENTARRSIYEATERWVMSQWIDERKRIDRVPWAAVLQELDDASKYFVDAFDDIWFFKKTVTVLVGSTIHRVDVALTMAFKDGGIFPGSSAQQSIGGIWQHSLLESYRHYLAAKNNPRSITSFPSNRVFYFAENADVAISQIEAAQDPNWPLPKVKFFRSESQLNGAYHVSRTILEGWESWHRGPIERFLY